MKAEIPKKEKKGITLIALVITIIVLLILAGVTVATLTGDNGLLTRASGAKNTTDKAKLEEEIKIAFIEYETDKYINSNSNLEDKLKAIFEKNYGSGNIEVKKNGKNYKAKVKNSKTVYRVKYDGTVEKYEEMDLTDIYGRLDENSKTVYLRATPLEGYIRFTGNIAKEFNNEYIYNVIIEEPIAPKINNLFELCSNLEKIENIKNLHTENMTSMNWMFYNCKKLTELDVSGFDTSNVKNLGSIFSNCSNLTNIDVSNFNTSNATSLSGMFNNCSKLTAIDVSGFDTSNVLDIRSIFAGCSLLTNIDVDNFDTSKVTVMSSMFAGCQNLIHIDVSGFDTRNVIYMADMFYGCDKLTNIDVSNFNTEKLQSIRYMFMGCSSLTELDISNFDTKIVTAMDYMFKNCKKLKTLNLGSSFVIGENTNIDVMFDSISSDINIIAKQDTADKIISSSNLTVDNFTIIK